METRIFVLPVIFVLAVGCVRVRGPLPVARRDLYSSPQQRIFAGRTLSEIAFPIGGIGTGTVSLGGRGDLRDWEIFNRPGKGKDLPFSFFAVWAREEGGDPVARILEREIIPPYQGGFGVSQSQLSGVGRLEEAIFRGEYPFAWINFLDRNVPVEILLEAWNPFVPLDDRASSIPVAIFRWQLVNNRSKPVDVSVAAVLFNPIGTDGLDFGGGPLGQNLNEYVEEGPIRGLRMSSAKYPADSPRHGTLALSTPWKDLDVQTRWYRGRWWDQAHLFWDDFADDGRVKDVKDAQPSPDRRSDVGDLVLHARIEPGESVTFPFFLTWHFPNRENYWNSEPEVKGKVMQNFVATQFKDAWDAALYTAKNIEDLHRRTRAWHRAFFDSNLPGYVLDAASSQASIIRTNTCLRLADGSFFGFEGTGDTTGCCPMNCTHVWNYEQTLAHLFPGLERSMRETDFLNNTRENGDMAFRSLIPLGKHLWRYRPAADGQMGCVMKAYREWKLSGDTEWLRKIWPGVRRALEFAWTKTLGWDPNKDGVMEGEQHNTYDIEFYGPNTMMGSLYLGALRAAEEMAQALGDEEKAKEYGDLARRGSERLDRELWNGEYYIQKVDVLEGIEVPEHLKSPPVVCCAGEGGAGAAAEPAPAGEAEPAAGSDVPKYQYGEGCLSDQLLGQWFAHVVGIGHLLDPERVRTAVHSIFKNNWREEIGGFHNVQRVYALNNDAGLLLCSWPKGNRPALPFVYSDEVWTGIEYQVAAHLIYEGWIEEGLKVVRGVRERYDGLRRNPWDEVECGHHYARAMASWSVLLALSGYRHDAVSGHLGFAPRIRGSDPNRAARPGEREGEFRCFWSAGTGWGSFSDRRKGDRIDATVEVADGSLRLRSFSLGAEGPAPESVTVKVDDSTIEATVSAEAGAWVLRFAEPIEIRSGQALAVSISM